MRGVVRRQRMHRDVLWQRVRLTSIIVGTALIGVAIGLMLQRTPRSQRLAAAECQHYYALADNRDDSASVDQVELAQSGTGTRETGARTCGELRAAGKVPTLPSNTRMDGSSAAEDGDTSATHD